MHYMVLRLEKHGFTSREPGVPRSIRLLLKREELPSKDTRRVFAIHSSDDGRTWSTPQEITAGVKKNDWTWYATGPGSGIQIEHGPHRGRLVIPCDPRTDCKIHHNTKLQPPCFSLSARRLRSRGGNDRLRSPPSSCGQRVRLRRGC